MSAYKYRKTPGLTGMAVALLASLLAFGGETPAHSTMPGGEGDSGQASSETVSSGAALSYEVRSSAGTLSQDDMEAIGGDPRVLDYWTPERMAEAIPVKTPEFSVSEFSFNAYAAVEPEQTIVEAELPTQLSNTESFKAPPVTNFSRTNGKVFFRDASNGQDYICSGAAINSNSKRLVATAGHCVHGGPGKTWHKNWIFVPGYHQGARPTGTFSAYQLRTYTDWINYGNSGRGFNSDVAFVTTYSNSTGNRLVHAVGGHGLTSGGNYDFDVSNFGYPGNLNSGEAMWACWGTTGSRYYSVYRFHSISGCNFGGGASGGPWLSPYSNSTGLGYIRSINSFGPINNTSYIAGPYLDSRVWGLYNNANADW